MSAYVVNRFTGIRSNQLLHVPSTLNSQKAESDNSLLKSQVCPDPG